MDTDSNNIIARYVADFVARNSEKVCSPSADYELDDDQRAMLDELRSPLEKVYPEEFARYLGLFYTYLPKKPFHQRFRYGDGFVCAKGRYKKSGESYDRTCCPALIGKHLDYWRWQQPRAGQDCPPNYWIAMYAGRKSAVTALDIDNKDNLLGYYQDGMAHLDHSQPFRCGISRQSNGFTMPFRGAFGASVRQPLGFTLGRSCLRRSAD